MVTPIPATLFLTVGYFVLYSSKKTEGPLTTFGFILSVWLFIVAGMYPVFGAWVSLSGWCPIEKIIEQFIN